MIKALTILFIFITVTIYAQSENKKIDNDLHYQKNISIQAKSFGEKRFEQKMFDQ